MFAHLLENTGNGPDRYLLAAVGPAGWAVSIYLDVDGDGALGAADTPLAGPVSLERGGSAALLAVVDVPEDATGDQGTIRVTATSEPEASLSASVEDVITLQRPLPAVTAGKTVDLAQAQPGDTLTYTLTYANRGDAVAPQAQMYDPLPPGVAPVAGTLTWNGVLLTDAADGDAGTVQDASGGRMAVTVRLGDLVPGASGTISFKVVVLDGAEGALSNVATLTYGDTSVAPPIEVSTPPVGTQVQQAVLAVTKELTGADTVRVGETVTFRLGWSNTGTGPARDVVLTDSLPAGMSFVSAEGSPRVEGRVVAWTLGTLEPGASGAVSLVARVDAAPGDGLLVNKVVLVGSNARSATAVAAGVQVRSLDGAGLGITKGATVLEAGLGDAIPYVVTLSNTGAVPLQGFVLVDSLPRGVELVKGSLVGADSIRQAGRVLTLWWRGPLAPRQEHAVRYTVTVVAPGGAGSIENRVRASAEDGRVAAGPASAHVRMRRGFAMQQRVVVGKVWVDLDGDGRQEAGEPGVPGVEVWTEDGEVVTTDREGRYTFPNLRTGDHALRLDTLALPAGAGVARRGDEIQRVRLDAWTLPRGDFRLVPRSAPADGAPADVEAEGAAPVRFAATGGAAPLPAPADTAGADTAKADSASPAPTVAPARTAEERAREERQAFLHGPVVRISYPADGAVIATNRTYVQVSGERDREIRLYSGTQQVGGLKLRPDGKADFVGVELAPGTHKLRVWMRNSFGNERWDSITVHRSGDPGRFELPAQAPVLRAEDRVPTLVRVRLLDTYGVPLPGGAGIAVQADGAGIANDDTDRTSVGVQLRADEHGWIGVALRPGAAVGPGELRLKVSKVEGTVPLRILPMARPLIVTGSGQVGVGAAAEAYGSVTVRGAVDEETSVSVSWDSRRTSQDDDFFARGFDPLDEGRYPTFGDGSQHRVLATGTTQQLSARVERGYDWVEVGDVRTDDFGVDPRLGFYQRAVTGMSGRVTQGALTWRGYGSVTDQRLEQLQARGEGTSGPYRFGPGMRPGTERIAVEVRARDNAARVIARHELVRERDYQIDYATGAVLLNQPLAAADFAGNPLFVVAMAERRTGGAGEFVGGLRLDLDARRWLDLRGRDSVGVSLLGVRDPGQGGGGGDLVGGGLRVRRGRLLLDGQVLRSLGDSSATAGRASATWDVTADGRATLRADWLGVEAGFAANADQRLSQGMSELRFAADWRPWLDKGPRLRLSHERQRFTGFDVERAATRLTAEQTVSGRKVTAEGSVVSDAHAGTSRSAATGRVTMALSDDATVWIEGAQQLSRSASPEAGLGTPDLLGLGASYRVLGLARVEASQRWARTRGDSAGSYALTSFAVRTERFFGGQLWAGLERADGERAAHAATLGWNQRIAIHGGWVGTAMYERRFGLSRAGVLDPERALPFAQMERERWATGAGLEYLPGGASARAALRGELHGGRDGEGHRVDFSADAPLGGGVAAWLGRVDLYRDLRPGGGGADLLSIRDRAVTGMAVRPFDSNALNLLMKLEWRRTLNPVAGGGVLGGRGVDRRLIGATDLVLGLRPGTELAGRYAVRWTALADSAAGVRETRTFAHFVGGRVEQQVRGPYAARFDARMLVTGHAHRMRWNLAASVVRQLGEGLELEGGYRWGALRDADFAREGGAGLYAALGIRFTEGLLGTAADFWRERIARDQ
ncbi:MAG TPA: SdrD B-like domain-containing protein [Longimicrobium sp.]|nr:SdrD B-like domain-containing protein [Longimicrobium sp.]